MSAIPLRRIEERYEILEKIREDGTGALYKVRHRLLDEVRVLNLMRLQLNGDGELRDRFLDRARLAIKLRHPNIAQLHDFEVDEETGTAYTVTDLLQGATLEEILSRHGAPPLGLALEIAQQSLRALVHLHDQGFIHRGISPDNLLLTEDPEKGPAVKLIDLGIADAVAEEDTRAETRDDLDSFGLVLEDLLAGPDVPDGLKALAEDPADRFTTAQEMSRALASFRSPGDISAADLRRVLRAPAAKPANVREEPAPTPADPGEPLDEPFPIDLFFRGGKPASGATGPPEKLLPPRKPKPPTDWRQVWLGAAVGALLAIPLAWWISRPPEPATGVLVVDAVPWGEVIQVLDADGVSQPLGEQRHTPLVLTLPPGRYTVTLRNPHFPQPVSLLAEVQGGAEARSVAEIGRVTEEELFRALGW